MASPDGDPNWPEPDPLAGLRPPSWGDWAGMAAVAAAAFWTLVELWLDG